MRIRGTKVGTAKVYKTKDLVLNIYLLSQARQPSSPLVWRIWEEL